MQGSVVDVHEPFEPNVGRLDQAVRFLLALGTLGLGLWSIPRVDAAWILPIFLAMLPLVAHFLLTAIVRTDIVYHFFGRTRVSRLAERRAERRRRPRAARPLR